MNSDYGDDVVNEMIIDTCEQSFNLDSQLNGDCGDDDDFDDFADFQEASPLTNGEINPTGDDLDEPSTRMSDDKSNYEPKNDGNFFSSIPKESTLTSNQTIVTKSLPSLDNIVNQSFIKANNQVNCDNYVENEQITTDLFSDKTSQSYKIWENLLNPEESTSFRLNWESSHSFQVFLRSLKINKNVDNFFIAAFESSSESDELTMSSPPVSQSSESQQIINKVSNMEISTSLQPEPSNLSSSSSASSTLPTTTSSSSSSSLSSVTSTSNLSNSVTSTIESIPQVSQNQENPPTIVPKTEATNSSASLSLSLSPSPSPSSIKPNTDSSESTNQSEENQPSINNQLSNNLLDVTFFLNNPNFMQPCSSPKASVKTNESEQSIQSNELSTKPLSIISSSSTDPFHNLISHIQDASSMRASIKSQSSSQSSTTKSTIPTAESTSKIFDELPLLSFMRTKLLLFPMRDSIKD